MNTNQEKFVGLCESIFELYEDPPQRDFIDCGLPTDLVALLNIESANLKRSNGMSGVPSEVLTKVTRILEKYVQEGSPFLPIDNSSASPDEVDALWAALNSGIAMGNIMASKNIPKHIYSGSVIKTLVLLIKFQLENNLYLLMGCVYPAADAGENKENEEIPQKKVTKVKSREVQQQIQELYLKLNELLGLVADVVDIVGLSDEVIASLCVIGLKPFFLDHVKDLQLTCTKLVTRLFKKYTNCRHLVMDQIFKLVGSLPPNERIRRTVPNKTTASENAVPVMNFTSVVFDIIQSIVWLPESIDYSTINADELVLANYKSATHETSNLLAMFLNKSMTKAEERVFRPLLDNFVQDLIATRHRPEWPAAEMVISQLGRSLHANFTSKHLDVAVRTVSIDMLGLLASRMREEENRRRERFGSIELLIRSDDEEDDDRVMLRGTKEKVKGDKEPMGTVAAEGGDKTELDYYSMQDLHGILLNFLSHHQQLDCSRCFHIIQWYRDTALFPCRPKEEKKVAPTSTKEAKTRRRKSKITKAATPVEMTNSVVIQLNEQHKEFLLTKHGPSPVDASTEDPPLPPLTYEEFVTISYYLVSRRNSPSSCNFEVYLQQTLSVLGDSSIQIRARALRSIRVMSESDPSLLARPEVSGSVDMKLVDSSPAVREATVDFVGRFAASRPDVFEHYYSALTIRILDSSLGVRKRIVRIFRDVCMGQPECRHVPRIFVDMMARLVDEEAVRRFVVESFESMWFGPGADREISRRRAKDITAAVAVCSQGQHLFELLLTHLLAPRDNGDPRGSKNVSVACVQIVTELADNTLTSSLDPHPAAAGYAVLLVFARVRPELLVKHFDSLRRYLANATAKGPCNTDVVAIVARTLELIVPLLKDTDRSVFDQLEADCIEIMRVYHPNVVTSVVPCLAAVVKNVTGNYETVRKFYSWYFMFLHSYRKSGGGALNMTSRDYAGHVTYLQRALFSVGILTRHFCFHPEPVPPAAKEAQKPAKEAQKPAKEAQKPAKEAQKPAKEVQKPVKEVQKPAKEAQKPAKEVEKPAKEAQKPAKEVEKPAKEAQKPAKEAQKLAKEAQKPAKEVEKPAKEAQKPAKEAQKPELMDGHVPTTDEVLTIVMFYIQQGCSQLQHYAVMALGNLCIRNHEYLLHPQVKGLYHQMLLGRNVENKAQVLSNIENYLLQEEKHVICINKQWKPQYTKQEKLKQMCDKSGALASTIVQIHLQDIVSTYVCESSAVRRATWRLVHLIARQGLVNVCPLLPVLIAMATDLTSTATASSSRKMMHEINMKFPTLILMKSMAGVRLSYDLQRTLKLGTKEMVRGFVKVEGDSFEAVNNTVYVLVRTNKQQRRALAIRLLKCFDESEKNTLFHQLYLADNLAYFSFQSVDEPMFIIHHLSMILAVSGHNTLDDYNQAFKPQPAKNSRPNEEMENVESIMNRMPEDMSALRTCIASTHGYLLLLNLKQHLKQMYGITDIKMHRYSPTEASKTFDKPVARRNRPEFTPDATLLILQSQIERSPITDLLDWFDRQKAAEQYVDFKQLMEDTDPTDMESVAYADKKIADYFQLVANRIHTIEEEPIEKKLKPARLPKQTKEKQRRTSLEILVPKEEETSLVSVKCPSPKKRSKTL